MDEIVVGAIFFSGWVAHMLWEFVYHWLDRAMHGSQRRRFQALVPIDQKFEHEKFHMADEPFAWCPRCRIRKRELRVEVSDEI